LLELTSTGDVDFVDIAAAHACRNIQPSPKCPKSIQNVRNGQAKIVWT